MELLTEGKSGTCGGLTRDDHVNYELGNINLVFADPHDGALKPLSIRNRRQGCKLEGKGQCRLG